MDDQLGFDFVDDHNGAVVATDVRWGDDVVTPIEWVGNVWLKRDDKFAIGGSRGGKVRTCLRLAVEAQARGATVLVTAGSRQSPQVNIVATIAATLGMAAECHVPEGDMTPELEAAVAQGATLVRHKPGYNSVIVARARESARRPGYAEIPFGMETPLAVDCTKWQVANVPLDKVRRLVVPVGSGMTLAGVLAGLALREYGGAPEVVGVVVGADPTDRLDRYAPEWRKRCQLVRSDLDYHTHAPTTRIGDVDLDPVYEAKCLPFLEDGDLLWIVGCRATVAPQTYTLTDLAAMRDKMWEERIPDPPADEPPVTDYTPYAVDVAIQVAASMHVPDDAAATADDVVPRDFMQDEALFDVELPPPVSLADRFVVPPFSVLNRRGGDWQERKRRWLSMGIESEVGRGDNLTFAYRDTDNATDFERLLNSRVGTTSVFDPVLCELVYRWFTAPTARVLDPFCGGSVRGVVASILGRAYTGVDIRPEQIDANHTQLGLCSGPKPWWLVGDATNLDGCLVGYQYDLVFSCPPYADLEVYSDDPRDISTWPYEDFVAGHRKAIADSCARLVEDRFAVWVIGDVRDKAGRYRGLHHETVEAFKAAGLHVVNEMVSVDPAGTAPVRCAAQFPQSRKVTLTHQHVLVFCKGDPRRAANWVNGV